MANAPAPAGSHPLVFDQRGDRRIDVVFAVAVDAGEHSQISRIIQLSRMGARLQVSQNIPIGQAIVLRRGGVELRGEVSWQRRDSVGVAFSEQLDERSFLQLRRHST